MTPDLRIVESEIGPVVPVKDIAEMIGYTRQALSGLIRSHKDTLLPFTITLSLPSTGGNQDTQCITRDGVDALFLFMRVPADPAKLARFIEVKKQIMNRIGEGKGAVMTFNHETNTAPLSGVLSEYARQAKTLASEWGVDLPVAQRVSMAAAIEKYPDLTPYRALVGADKPPADIPALPAPDSLPRADPDYDKYFSLRKVAQFCQCQENQARKILVDEGVIAYQNDHCILTRYGERYGKVFKHYPEFPHRMTEKIMIRYAPEAVQLVRGKLFCIQTTLPAAKARA